MMGKLTKCEKLILKLISSTGGCDYSYSEISGILKISRQTVYLCLNRLLEDNHIEKSYFYLGRVKRCKYAVSNFFSNSNKMNGKNFTSSKNESGKNFTSYKNESGKNFTSSKKLEERNNKTIGLGWVKSLWHKKEPSRKTRLTQNSINDFDIYNINNIYKSNQSKNTMVLSTCQEVKLNFFKKIDKILGSNEQESNTVHSFKIIAKKIFCEKNDNAETVRKFFEQAEEQDLHDLLWSIVNSVTRRMLDKTKAKIMNLYGYIRIALINAVQAFYASKVDESEAKTLLYESVVQLHCPSATNSPTVKSKIDCSSLAHNFEQREYSVEYLESFYKNLGNDVVKSSPALSKSKIDTTCLARNFEQREYSEEYLESFYKNFAEVPATSSSAKDIVMEQVRAMRDSFSERGQIKPASCADLY